MKPLKTALRSSLLLALILTVTGCAQTLTRTEYIRPTCQPPVMDDPPFIDSAELWLLVGPDLYDKLEQGMVIRDAHINKQAMMIEVLCDY